LSFAYAWDSGSWRNRQGRGTALPSPPKSDGRRRKIYRIVPEGAKAIRRWYDGIRDLGDGARARIDVLAEGAG